MSLTARHKKPGGFKKLVNSLELTPHDRRKKILDAMRGDDDRFVAEVERCIFEFEEFKDISDMIITDIVYAMKSDMKSVAVALYKCKDEALLQKFTKNMLSAQGAAYNDEKSMLDKVTVSEQKGARFRIIEKARELQNSGVIVLKKYSPDYQEN